MWFLVIAAIAAAGLFALEYDLLMHFQERPFGQDLLEIEEILLLSTVIVGSLLAFGALRLRAHRREINRRRAAERYALDLAFHDPLTGLPNRRSFMEQIEAARATPPRGTHLHAVMLMDLNSFKAVNDTYGHPAGDELLIEIAKALKSAVGTGIFVARLGGDEFALIARDVETAEAAAGIGHRAIAALSAPFKTKSGEHRVGAGIGIALIPQDGNDHAELVRKADLALYRAKDEGSSSLTFFESQMDAKMREWAFVESELRGALGTDTIAPRYRPNIDLESGLVTAFEIEPSWDHPGLGCIPLQRFIPVAEDSGLIREITDHILRSACLDAAAWPNEIGLSMRLSGTVIRDPGLALRILGILAETHFQPSRLEISISESALVRNIEESKQVLMPLRNSGVKLALADFGTSYSSIWHLRDLKFDKLKIDRSFIDDMDRNPTSAVIVNTILGMGKGLGIAISAEGIDQSNQRERLFQQGLSEGQGSLFGGHSLGPNDAKQLVRSRIVDSAQRA